LSNIGPLLCGYFGIGWFVLHGPIAALILVDVGRGFGRRRVLFFALVIKAERGERNAPDFHGRVSTASFPFLPCYAVYAVHADPAGRDDLQRFLESQPIWMPTEGRFEPLLQSDFLHVFAEAGADELIFVPEFPNSDPVVRSALAGLRDGTNLIPEGPFPARGTLLAPDHSFLLTVDWDSFFTLFYGARSFVARVAAGLNLEGFFATPNTEHAWYNYSFGCATVTLSPEHWQTT